jgi:hypothetical protein
MALVRNTSPTYKTKIINFSLKVLVGSLRWVLNGKKIKVKEKNILP